jgi:hypothetical protein
VLFAEFERAMIQERVRAGLARAKSQGKRLGRPRIAAELEARIRKALAIPGRPGVSLAKCCRHVPRCPLPGLGGERDGLTSAPHATSSPVSKGRLMRCTVPGSTPNCSAILRKIRLCARAKVGARGSNHSGPRHVTTSTSPKTKSSCARARM